MDETIGRSWDQLPEEPDVWYKIFKDYYVALGDKRSLRNAFEFYIRVEAPKQYKDLDPDNFTKIPQHWSLVANEWNWAERAMQYDESKVPDFSALYVTQVLDYLQRNALGSAQALVAALNSERTRVQAANSILNRIGVPESTTVTFRGGVSFSADDMAIAANKVEEWKKQKQGPSGSPAELTSPTS